MLYLLLREMTDWLDRQGLYGFFSVLDQVQFRSLAAAGLSFVIVIALGRPTIAWLKRKRIGDTGMSDAEALKRHANSKANIPTMGGVLIAGSIAASVLLLANISEFYVYAGLIVLFWLAVLGGVDDWLKLTAASRGSASRQGLFAWEKLVFQLGIGVIVGLFAYGHGDTEAPRDLAHVINIPLQRTYQPGSQLISDHLLYFGKLAFVVWVALFMTGISNAVNITDGMDGLASGTCTAVSFGLVVLALIAGTQRWAQYLLVPYIPGSEELGVLAGATAGACLGFLWWNCSPAQVFMGDTGALSLGGIIAYIAVVTRQEIVTLLMCGVFLVELASVTLQVGYFKISRGKRIFRCAPYHHHLHLKGWTEQQIVARAWIVGVLLVVLAIATLKLR